MKEVGEVNRSYKKLSDFLQDSELAKAELEC